MENQQESKQISLGTPEGDECAYNAGKELQENTPDVERWAVARKSGTLIAPGKKSFSGLGGILNERPPREQCETEL